MTARRLGMPHRTWPVSLSRELERELIVAGKAGDIEARNRVVMGCARLVFRYAVLIARRSLSRGNVRSIQDRYQEGMLSLLHAFDLYDLSLGYRFSTYAMFWAKNFMQRRGTEQIVTGGTKRLAAEIRRVTSIENQALLLNGETERLHESVRMDLLLATNLRPISIDEEGIDDLEGLACRGEQEELVARAELIGLLNQHMGRLSEKEQRVLRAFYGDDAGGGARLARVMGVSRQRVEQIRNVALAKLQRSMVRAA